MERRIKYFLHVFFICLIVCHFGTAISSTTSPSTAQTTAASFSEPSTPSPSTAQTKTVSSSLPSTTSPSTAQTTAASSSVPSTAAPFTETKTSLPSSPPTTVNNTCDNLGYVNNVGNWGYHNWYISDHNNGIWNNMSFWGGYLQIPWKENLDDTCVYWPGSYLLTLMEKHKDIADIGEDIVTADACILTQNQTTDNCTYNALVEMRICNDSLLYRFLWTYSHFNDTYLQYNTYICFDRNHTETCELSDFVYTAGNVTGSFLLNILYYDIQHGWFDAHRDGKQYVLPSSEDVEGIFEKCLPEDRYYNGIGFLRDGMPENIGDVPVRLRLCYVYKYYNGDYGNYNDYTDNYYYDDYCSTYVYARKCSGKIQFDLPLYWSDSFCFIHYNNVTVLPEIGHTGISGNDGTTIYSPFLQFRCSFEMAGTVAYRVNWYINGTLWMETGPSTLAENLALKGESLNELRLGYQVKCGVIAMGTNDTSETFSDEFYAGWKISDTSIKLSKNGYAIMEVEQTVPLGCAHAQSGAEDCKETLSLVDPNFDPDGSCKAGIRVLNADEKHLSYHKIKSLKLGEKWDANVKYKFRLSTIDHDYDDKLYFEMELMVSKDFGHTPRADVAKDTEKISTVQVTVTESSLHWNKRCYSHADPHMRTGDGRYYGHQKVGDYMFYQNKAYQSEVHEYARYCWDGYDSGPVCACGVAVRSGADVFMINRCGNFTILDFLQCGDGGILDVEPIHGYRYKVTTPIGTIIFINLHSWGKTLDIDIYLSAKDFGSTDGLCGFFDGDRTNDFRHRDGSISEISNEYYNYEFSDSWRLLDEENFLKNANRSLEPWDENNGGTTGHPCFKPDSITKNKCEVQRRKRREATFRFGTNVTSLWLGTSAGSKRERRSTGHVMTEEEARSICNSSIYEAPSVREFSDKLADEDPEAVLTQCVFDIIHGNDTVWAEAHVNALNNIATSVISLNPVYAANNSESVKAFLSQTCLNNCSGHGECSDTGLCTCEGIFRGPDCGIDLRIPPIIYDIQDGGLCDTANDEECDCFVFRTDNIFEGFTFKISSYEFLFDGTRKQLDQSVYPGEYEDIFTGVCCVPQQRKRRSVEDSSDPSIMMFDIVVSNDGSNFGQSKSVYVFDSTCIHFELVGGIVTIVLKDGYCFIGGICVAQKSTLETPSGCYVCDAKIPYAWTHVSCGGDNNVGLATSTLIAVITGSVLAGIIVTMAIVYILCFKGSKKRRAVEDIQSSQAYVSSGPARQTWTHK